MATPRILFVHNALTEFVRLDLEELRKLYDVTEYSESSRVVKPASLWREVKRHDLIFGWFASWHTFLPLQFAKILGKPSVLVIGGYDVANMPEINYGHQRGGMKKVISRRAIGLATRLITNSGYSRDEIKRNLQFTNGNLSMVYHGIPDRFGALPTAPRQPMALTVGNVDEGNLLRKGHEAFVRTARLLPDVQFVLVGNWKDRAIERLKKMAAPNVTFTGRVTDDELSDYYKRASVYVQASLHEGFGMSVAESMLAGCVPVTTRAGALPEVTGDCGAQLNSTDPSEIAQGIQAALCCSDEERAAIRNRILEEFPLTKRGAELERVIAPLLDGTVDDSNTNERSYKQVRAADNGISPG